MFEDPEFLLNLNLNQNNETKSNAWLGSEKMKNKNHFNQKWVEKRKYWNMGWVRMGQLRYRQTQVGQDILDKTHTHTNSDSLLTIH